MSDEAKILYVSESISSLLGLSQVVMIGTQIQEYIHHEDQEFVENCIGIKLVKSSDLKSKSKY